MRELNPQIELQHQLAQQIFNALQGEVTEDIRQKCQGNANDRYFRSAKEGNSLKVNETLLPQFYNLCREVKEKLEFVGDIDFYITGTSDVNACAYFSNDEQRPHIIEVNSGLFKLMNEEELKYIIGHEIGHLINCDSMINNLFYFIYPDEEALEKCPEFLVKRVAFYGRLAELGADFYGYIANENLDACVTAVYKMASELDLAQMNVSIDTLIAENNQRLDYFLKEGGVTDGSHPVNPIRIRALELFATAKTQAAFNRGMNDLVWALQKLQYDALDNAIADYIAAAGIFISQMDGKRDKNEEEFIIRELAAYSLSPYKDLKRVEKGDVVNTLNTAIKDILEMAPDLKGELFNYFVNMAFADGELNEKELALIYDFGDKLGYHESEIAEFLCNKIRKEFVPSVSALK
ncbi:MAG: M48 family metalloprotease [Bacteroidaceae bacterium]|nr:M48 family metalloprotease [Bacteroidaceae bacterium]